MSTLSAAGDPRPIHLGAGHALLRDLTGADERMVSGTTTRDACDLLDRLLLPTPGASAEAGRARTFTVAERDRLLAEVHLRTYGPRIRGTSRCGQCDQRFDLDFQLPDLLRSLPAPAREVVLADGTRLRVPTGEDELAVEGLAPEQAELALINRCVIDGPSHSTIHPGEVGEALDAAAPVLDLDADGTCPECGAAQAIRFSIQGHLLGMLVQERRRLLEEVHLLAVHYGWSLGEILGLFRSERRELVDLIDRRGGA